MLGFSRRNCYFSDEKRLRFFNKYSNENCNTECRSNASLEICGCIPFYSIRESGTFRKIKSYLTFLTFQATRKVLSVYVLIHSAMKLFSTMLRLKKLLKAAIVCLIATQLNMGSSYSQM